MSQGSPQPGSAQQGSARQGSARLNSARLNSARQNADLARALLEALREVPGLAPAQPATVPARLPWDSGLLAVDVDRDQVTIQLVARELPLPPLLAKAGSVLRAVLDSRGLAGLRLRLEVTDLDRAAFGRPRRASPARTRRGARATDVTSTGRET